MAGQPRRRAVIGELEKRAARDECSVLDYVVSWIESGGTLYSLAKSVKRVIDAPTDDRVAPRATIENYVKTLRNARGETGDAVLLRARSSSGSSMAEETLEIADEGTEDNAAATRLRVGARQWLAERLNRDLQQQKGASVHIHVGALHLDALRTRDVTGVTVALPAPEPAQIAAQHDVEDAQVIEISEDH